MRKRDQGRKAEEIDAGKIEVGSYQNRSRRKER